MFLGALVSEVSGRKVSGWINREENVAAFHSFVSNQANSEEGRRRAADFEWFLSEFVGQSFESSGDFLRRPSKDLTLHLRKKRGTPLSLFEKAALYDHQLGSSIFLVVSLFTSCFAF
jgi:hypothetical protein